MGIAVYFAAGARLWPEFSAPLDAAFRAAGLDARMSPEAPADPGAVDYIIYAPGGDIEDFGPFTRAKAVLSLWAGVERITGNPTLTMPLCRMVDGGLTEGMAEWVAGHALRHHLGMDAHIVNPGRVWDNRCPPLARERPVGMLGLGELGAACAQALAGLHFPVTGWSRTPKTAPGVRCVSGAEGFEDVLRRSQILVTLLPLTAGTENILNARAFGLMRKGMVILNPGRGALIDDAALLSALADGTVSHATLDVFREEPLPQDHPFWSHPKVTVTPHIAADTRPSGAARVIAENIRRGEAGEPFLYQVDRARGY